MYSWSGVFCQGELDNDVTTLPLLRVLGRQVFVAVGLEGRQEASGIRQSVSELPVESNIPGGTGSARRLKQTLQGKVTGSRQSGMHRIH